MEDYVLIPDGRGVMSVIDGGSVIASPVKGQPAWDVLWIMKEQAKGRDVYRIARDAADQIGIAVSADVLTWAIICSGCVPLSCYMQTFEA